MKHNIYAISILIPTILLSCSRMEPIQEIVTDHVDSQYEIVANVSGDVTITPQTKAIKTDWADGEKIFVFQEDCSTGYVTLTYDSSESVWAPEIIGDIDQYYTDTAKKLCAIYVPYATSSTAVSFSAGKWTLETGDVFYTYDSDVAVTRRSSRYLEIQITLQAPSGYIQIYVDNPRIKELMARGQDVTMTCTQIDRYNKVTLTGTAFSGVKNTSDSRIIGKTLTVGATSGTVFYGKKGSATGNARITIVGGPVEYSYDASTSVASNTAYDLTESGWKQLLVGEFNITVSSTNHTVRFTPGNLQANYNAGTPKWHIAQNQYDIIGSQDISKYKTKTDGTYPWYDLFGWGATGKAASGSTAVPFWEKGSETPTGSATEQAKFRKEKNSSGANLPLDDDWGANIVDNASAKTYQTMTNAQWRALFEKYKPVASYITIDGKTHYGMVIQPSGTPKTSYTLSAWRTAEMNGAVFFPSAGFRNGNTSTQYNTVATGNGFFYWSRTLSDETGAEQSTYKLPYGFGVYGTDTSNYTMVNWRSTGRPVRLVELQ